MNEIQAQWENLHQQPRFRPLYPQEVVVRFLMREFPRDAGQRAGVRVLDLGCGTGRHALLFAEQGFETFGIDISGPGLEVAQERLSARGLTVNLTAATMHALPFADESLDGVVSYGVLEYNNWRGIREAVTEIFRVLKLGGKLLAVTRTADDYRYGKGKRVDGHSFVLDIAETNEPGMLMCFLNRQDVQELFGAFRRVTVDHMEVTTDEWRRDSDWIVTATK